MSDVKRGTKPQIGDTVTVTRSSALNASDWGRLGEVQPDYVVVGTLVRTDRTDVAYHMADAKRREVHPYELRPAYLLNAKTRRLVSRGTWHAVEVEVLDRPEPDMRST